MERVSHPAKPTLIEAQRSALLQLTRLLDMPSDAVMVRDLTGVLTYWNQGAARLYGWDPSEAIGMSAPELLGTIFPASKPEIEAEVRNAGTWEGVLRQHRQDGCDLTVESRWELFCDEQGKPRAVLQVDRPLSTPETGLDPSYAAQRTEALEKANYELKASDHNKDEFLSVISHELKTPLNFITGFASILGDEVTGPLNADQHLQVRRIQDGAARLLAVVNDLLDMGKMAADKATLSLSEEAFAGLVEEAIAMLRPARGAASGSNAPGA